MAKDREIKIQQIVQMVKRRADFKVLRSKLERRKFKMGGQIYFGNGMKESKYWVSEEDRNCRLWIWMKKRGNMLGRCLAGIRRRMTDQREKDSRKKREGRRHGCFAGAVRT